MTNIKSIEVSHKQEIHSLIVKDRNAIKCCLCPERERPAVIIVGITQHVQYAQNIFFTN